MKRWRWAGVCVATLSAAVVWGADQMPTRKDLETVKARLVAEAGAQPPDPSKVRALVQTQKPDGSWDGIPYAAKDRTLWPPMEHLNRLTQLAKACSAPAASEAERAAAGPAFVKAFDFWVAKDPQSSNWWYNQIGAPQALCRAMLLAEPLLTEGRLGKGCALLARARLGMTGQNLVWLAENVIGRASLQGDAPLMAEAFGRIESTIVITDKEGIQPDFSFHQHGDQFYSGGYGGAFAASAPRFARLAQGTGFAFAPEKVRILENYLLDGQQWLIRGRTFDYSASGRDLTRPNSGGAAAYAGNAQALLALDSVTRRGELERMAARIASGITAATPPLVGHRHFWRSDYTAHHCAEWMASVRMTSERLLQTEIVNEENQLGEHLSDGVMYLYRTGAEYQNIFPAWDWARLPGITVEHDRPLRRINNGRRGARAFAGGCSDGARGVSAMDFERDGLTARKAWFFFDSEAVCLGAGIASTGDYSVITSVNQCIANGPVTARRAGGVAAELKAPRQMDRPVWVHHDGMGYVFLDAAEGASAGTGVQTGSWRRISLAQKADPVAVPVFSLWLDHGKQPREATYAYVVTAREDGAATDAYARALPVHVAANTRKAQAVEHTKADVLQVVFHEAGSVRSRTWGEVSVDAPCLLMLSRAAGKTRVTACNPCNREGAIRVTAGRRSGTLRLPAGPRAGASATLEL